MKIPKHVLSSKDMYKELLDIIFKVSDLLENAPIHLKSTILRGKYASICIFTESTRTRFSFEKAIQDLGGKVTVLLGTRSLSTDKGESVHDVFLTLATLGYKYFIIRHSLELFPHNIAKMLDDYGFEAHVINAGDGWNEHPTQAIGDLYTLYRVFNKFDDLGILFIGDLVHHRVLHSLLTLLAFYKNIRLYFMSPKKLGLPEEYRKNLNNIYFDEFYSETIDIITDIINKHEVNVIYVLPIMVSLREKYRLLGLSDIYDIITNYTIKLNVLNECKRPLYVMHPLPRHGMIPVNLDSSVYALYIKQIYYGYLSKQALIALLEKGLDILRVNMVHESSGNQ